MKYTAAAYHAKAILFLLILTLPLLSSCTTHTTLSSKTKMHQAYLKAVQDARIAEPAEISKNLTAITESNPNLIWKNEAGQKRILVATWTAWSGYDDKVSRSMVTTRNIWVTAAPQLKDFCQKNKLTQKNLILRLEQVLGLPPGSGKNRFIEIWVNPGDLFRPSPDPEITDQEAQLSFPESVDKEHVRWFNDLAGKSYGKGGYPWTRLGYTYDWGNPAREVGLSEFIIKKGARIEIHSVSDVNTYCR